MIMLAPDIIAAYGSPHELAWNIGTTASTRSPWRMDRAVGVHSCMECR